MNVPRLQKLPPFEGYVAKPVPLGSYAALLVAWSALAGAALAAAPRRRLPAADFLLLALATHKLARIVTKDWVTSPLRAPFTEFVETAGAGELVERARGHGLRRAVGDLATCAYCVGPWIALGLAAGFATRPKETRFVATVFALTAVSDFLHHAYGAVQRASSPEA